jgi:hypothetical protein
MRWLLALQKVFGLLLNSGTALYQKGSFLIQNNDYVQKPLRI